MNKDNAIGFGIGVLTGAIIGGVIALLYAPKTGTETRKIIKDKTIEVVDAVKDKGSEVFEAVKSKSGEVAALVKEEASEINRKGQAAIKAIRS
jgi:gas vesicle protein